MISALETGTGTEGEGIKNYEDNEAARLPVCTALRLPRSSFLAGENGTGRPILPLPRPSSKAEMLMTEEQCDFDRGIALCHIITSISFTRRIDQSINSIRGGIISKIFETKLNLSNLCIVWKWNGRKRNFFRKRFTYLLEYIARKSIWPDHWFGVSGNVSLYPFLYYPLGSRRRIAKILRQKRISLSLPSSRFLPPFSSLPPSLLSSWSTRMLDSMLDSRLLPSSMVYLFIENCETFAESKRLFAVSFLGVQ